MVQHIYIAQSNTEPQPWVRPDDACIVGGAHTWEWEVLLDSTSRLYCSRCNKESNN